MGQSSRRKTQQHLPLSIVCESLSTNYLLFSVPLEGTRNNYRILFAALYSNSIYSIGHQMELDYHFNIPHFQCPRWPTLVSTQHCTSNIDMIWVITQAVLVYTELGFLWVSESYKNLRKLSPCVIICLQMGKLRLTRGPVIQESAWPFWAPLLFSLNKRKQFRSMWTRKGLYTMR